MLSTTRDADSRRRSVADAPSAVLKLSEPPTERRRLSATAWKFQNSWRNKLDVDFDASVDEPENYY